jgi:hypothetical protein
MNTPLDVLVEALTNAASWNPAAEAPPEAVLWCDPGREFSGLIPPLRARLPHLLSLGDFDSGNRSGPAFWLRVVVGRKAPEVTYPVGTVPILWLPGIARETLRGAEDCPALLQPLVWFTVAGAFFGHVNGKDWTLRGFLASERGRLKLDIPEDAATRAALALAASRVAAMPIAALQGRRWDALAIHALLAPDLPADTLEWIEGRLNATSDAARFGGFAVQAARELAFDPRKLSAQDAVSRLVQQQGRWVEVWNRFAASAGDGYPTTAHLLWAERPPDLLTDQAAFPSVNAEAEKQLRALLLAIGDLNPSDARARLRALEQQHASRRNTVWGRRGEAPLATALAHLAQLADVPPLPTQNAAALANAYADVGWRADWAALEALAAAPRETDREAIAAVLRAIYVPWAEDGATALQTLARNGCLPWPKPVATNGSTVVFVDGLRLDLAHALVSLLKEDGCRAELSWTWSGFPTVTATCKPLVSPVSTALHGEPDSEDLLPLTSEGKAAAKPVLMKAMVNAGWSTTDTLLPEGKLWTECGRFDEEGHALGSRMAERVQAGLRDVADRILQLARAGRSVRVVTDHGWLLLPGGLPHAPLDSGLVAPEGKRSRCARVKPTAPTTYLQLPWTWHSSLYVAVATGIRSFLAGQEYAHGGLSPQECVLPVIAVTPVGARRSVSITKAQWVGLRLRLEVSGGADMRVDLRLGAETSGPSLVEGVRVLDEAGKTSMLLSDEYEGKVACVVILADDGTIVARQAVTVGGD